MIEEIKFSETLSVWKTKYVFNDVQSVIKKCYEHINNNPTIKNEAYGYYEGIFKTEKYFNHITNNELEVVRNFGINSCADLHNRNDYKEIAVDTWINIVRIEPKQRNIDKNDDLIFHVHSDLSKKLGKIIPNYTFVVYIQMPNNLSGEDGVIYFKDTDGKIFHYLPEVGDCLIMDKDLPHVPAYAKKSTLDRVVLAGNVTFQQTKTQKTLL